MKVLVINGSPKVNTVLHCKLHCICKKSFRSMNSSFFGPVSRLSLWKKIFHCGWVDSRCRLDYFSYPVYTFIEPSQLHRFIELLKASGLDVSGKFATQITTSKHFYDVTAHKYIQDNCQDLGMNILRDFLRIWMTFLRKMDVKLR